MKNLILNKGPINKIIKAINKLKNKGIILMQMELKF